VFFDILSFLLLVQTRQIGLIILANDSTPACSKQKHKKSLQTTILIPRVGSTYQLDVTSLSLHKHLFEVARFTGHKNFTLPLKLICFEYCPMRQEEERVVPPMNKFDIR
jgi:hypothetical protein